MMAVTAAPRLWPVVKSTRSTAASVRASTQTTKARTHVACPTTRETATATTRTTTKVVTTMAVTAAPRLWTVVKSARSTAASVSASIQTTKASLQEVKNAACPITRETATATTRTTTKGVRMMAVTAAPRLWTVVKSARSTAASVRASIQTTRVHQLQNVESLSTRETAIATTRTTMKDAGTTVAIAALKLWKEAKCKRSTAASASASTPREVVDFPSTLETATATTRTTTKGVSSMAVTAVPKLWKVVK